MGMQSHVSITPATQISSKRLAAGRASAEAIGELLGLARVEGYAIRAVCWDDHAVEASVAVGEEEVVFRLERRSDESEGLVLTSTLALHYRGAVELPPALVEVITREAPKNLAPHTIESLSALIAQDPELGKPGLPTPPGVDDREHPRSLLDTWGGDASYADFFAGGEIARAQLDTIDLTKLFLFIQHGDNECVHVNPHTVAPITWLVSYPWEERIRSNRWPKGEPLFERIAAPMLSTDLDEHDVIAGSLDKVQDALARGQALAEASDRVLFLSNTCVPMVTGEDVESEVKRRRARGECILYLTTSPRSMVNVFHDILVTRRRRAEARVSPTSGKAINLIGFPERVDTSELVALLGELDIEVNVLLLPRLEVELVDRLPRAVLNVFFPNQTWQHLYDQLTFDSKIRGLSPSAPFGFSGTEAWLRKIAAALEIEDAKVDAVWRRIARAHHSSLKQISDDAASHRIGLVVRQAETFYVTSAASTWGVPVTAVLEEIGFGLDVIMELSDKKRGRAAAWEVHDAFRYPERHSIKGFNSREMMRRRLAESPCDAILTSHTFDWRVTQAGKNVVSLQTFEMGPAGLCRTARRLVDACRTPLFQRYCRYFARTDAGLRKARGT